MYSFCCAEIRLAPYCLESLNIVWYKAKVKRAQRHMKIKEMAKKTSLATTSEEDGDNGMVDCCIRIITACHASQTVLTIDAHISLIFIPYVTAIS